MSWRRGQAYGQDLRDRVLAAPDLTLRQAAERFAVSPSFVAKARARLRDTGHVTPGPQHNLVPPRLSPLHDALRARVASEADRTVAELRAWLAAAHGAVVGHAAMWRTLDRLGLTRKKSRSGRRSRTART